MIRRPFIELLFASDGCGDKWMGSGRGMSCGMRDIQRSHQVWLVGKMTDLRGVESMCSWLGGYWAQ